MSLVDDVLGALAKETGVPPAVVDLALKLAKLAVAREDDPEAYFQTLLDDQERRAQQRAREKFG